MKDAAPAKKDIISSTENVTPARQGHSLTIKPKDAKRFVGRTPTTKKVFVIAWRDIMW